MKAIPRREFLKKSAICGGLLGAGGALFGTKYLSTLAEAADSSTGSEKWIPSACDMCDQGCGINVCVVDGIVRKVEGISHHPLSLGKNCCRPNAYMTYLYNPYRVKAPMKRTNPVKGIGVDPKWVEITWDEALNTVAAKMKALREKDPQRLWQHNGHRSMGNFWSDWANVYGTQTRIGSVNFCTGGANHMSSVYYQGSGGCHPTLDFTRYFIEIGGRLYGAKGGPEVVRKATRQRKSGMRVLNLCPIIAPCNPNPDEWLPIKVGTDTAFILSVMYVMFFELGRDYPGYDWEFLRDRTNAPYLIKPDGYYYRAEAKDDELIHDHTRMDHEFGKPLIWDPVDKKAKVFDDPTIKDYAITGSYKVKWKELPEFECKTGLQMLMDKTKDYTPEKAEKICDIPAATIRRVTKEFIDNALIGSTIDMGVGSDGEPLKFRFRPSAFSYSKSYSGSRGWSTQGALKCINALIGNNNVPGGWGDPGVNVEANPADGLTAIHEFSYSHVKFPPEHPGLNFDSRTGGGGMYPMIYNLNTLAWYAMHDPEKYYLQHPCEIYFVNNANLFGNSFNPEFIAEAMQKIDFMVACPYHFDEICDMCDIILPQDTHLDGALEPLNADPYCTTEPYGVDADYLTQPVVERTHNTMNIDDILTELHDRMGLLANWNRRLNRRLGKYPLDLDKKYSIAEIMDRKFKVDYGEDKGLDYMKRTGYIWKAEEGVEGSFKDLEYPDSRYRVYVEEMVWAKDQWKKDLEKLKKDHGVTLRPSNEFVLDMMLPVPEWRVRPYEEFTSEYDLYCVHYKTMTHSMAVFMDNAWISEYNQLFDPYSMKIQISREAAEKRGIKNGDVITYESIHGKDSTECVVTELVRPDTIAVGGSMGSRSVNMFPPANDGALFNRVCWADENWRDPVTGNQENSMKVKVYKGAVNKKAVTS